MRTRRKMMPPTWVQRAAIYLFCIAVSFVAAFLLRYDFVLTTGALVILQQGLLIAVLTKSAVFHLCRLHHAHWEATEFTDLAITLCANLAASLVNAGAAFLLWHPHAPWSVYLVDFALCSLMMSAACSVARLRKEMNSASRRRSECKHVLIYGAGSAGRTLLREIRSNRSLGYAVAGFLDDDPAKRKTLYMGAGVLGAGRSAAIIVDRLQKHGIPVEEIIIAMPSASGAQMREALANCRASNVTCKTIPGLSELLTGKVLTAQVRNVQITDLLGREPVKLEEDRIRDSLCGRAVLVTGGAGSIGSELCRQIAGFGASKVVIFDHAESDLFRIDMELREVSPHVTVVPEIGDICDPMRVEEVMRAHSVSAVFHAAAYKHVPMMEMHPLPAVENNVFGTWNVAHAALKCGVRNFLMISSDKAVNPTSVMGTTKRVAELIVASMPAGKTTFVSVRFGNVLASNGSVVGIFRRQIEKGGPVTLTHPDMRRYFMTIPEAVQLVLQASTMGHGSEIFVLDMGQPVRIMDLAENLIRLSGYTPYRDIDIRVTGLRPGEKLYEEIMIKGENVVHTYHPKVKIFAAPRPDYAMIGGWMAEMERRIHQRDQGALIELLSGLVPEYTPQGIWARKRIEPAPVPASSNGSAKAQAAAAVA
jgi:FlaA1/EpsC-like NDP-sugar epimerase